jgi:hypothetical protein
VAGDVVPVKIDYPLSFRNALSIQLVLESLCKGFHDHKVLSRAESENRAGLDFNQPGAVDRMFLKGQGAERDVYANPFKAFERKNAILSREISTAFHARSKRHW